MVSEAVLNAAVGRMRHLGDITKIDCTMGGLYYRRFAVSGFEHCGQACRSGGCSFRSVYGANTTY